VGVACADFLYELTKPIDEWILHRLRATCSGRVVATTRLPVPMQFANFKTAGSWNLNVERTAAAKSSEPRVCSIPRLGVGTRICLANVANTMPEVTCRPAGVHPPMRDRNPYRSGYRGITKTEIFDRSGWVSESILSLTDPYGRPTLRADALAPNANRFGERSTILTRSRSYRHRSAESVLWTGGTTARARGAMLSQRT